MSNQATFLFSVDFEEFEALRPTNFYRTPLPGLTKIFLDFLKNSNMTATFFVVGKVAQYYPEIIAAIFDAGHELACHTYQHDTLNVFSPAEFRTDLERNRDAILAIVPTANITGFRAPLLSLTSRTIWAYEILADLGFTYSSSVLPASNPLFGCPEFGSTPRLMKGVWELPITLGTGWRCSLPFAGGTYFRCLPAKMIFKEFERAKELSLPIVGYLHPYDADIHQQYVLHKQMRNTPYLNPLLYWGRQKTIPRLYKLIENGFVVERYDRYLLNQTLLSNTN